MAIDRTAEPYYEVLYATTAEKALNPAFSADRPDLILLDITMPDMDGYQIFSRLKANDFTRDIQIVFATARSDVIIPGEENGVRMTERLRAQWPGMKVLYMSGYTNNAIVHQGVLAPGLSFIQKPFLLEDLARKVRQTLDSDDQV